jgi:hypothetical protein
MTPSVMTATRMTQHVVMTPSVMTAKRMTQHVVMTPSVMTATRMTLREGLFKELLLWFEE